MREMHRPRERRAFEREGEIARLRLNGTFKGGSLLLDTDFEEI
jgi:hypothetical protein